jgi:serine/threonine protein kinase/tetratricopeptide (TPR) repeat protein
MDRDEGQIPPEGASRTDGLDLREPSSNPTVGLRAIRAGDLLGRYVIVDRLGAGGMGTVFSAYDRELDRKVALKVLLPEAVEQESAQQRLVREAQAMAKLDHPNVVTVFDVGVHEGRVFVAMEFVRGVTLRAWQKQDRRWTEVVDAYRQAARGLQAAHDAGLIHRDFKPDNAMVDSAGRVRVMDFGLVRAEGAIITEIPTIAERKVLEAGAEAEAEAADDAMARIRARMEKLGRLGTSTTVAATDPPPAADSGGRVTGASALGTELTREGTVMGTPAYMSPEQLEGKRVDARSDQFSFCVALYEALFGERPFGTGPVMATLERMNAGTVEAPPADSPVPSEVRDALIRGLAAKPGERYASLAELEEAIARLVQPKPLRMAWPVGLTLAVVVGASLWAYGQQQPPCRGGAAIAAKVWNEPRQLRIKDAFADTGVPFYGDAVAHVLDPIDGHVEDWVAMHREACEATQLRREQSSTMLDLRMACLGRRLDDVDALADVFEHADAEAVERAALAVKRLPPVSECADADRLLAEVPPPSDPAVAERVEELDRRLAMARAEVATGHYAQAAEQVQAVVDQAGETGYGPIMARANYELGVALDYDGKYDAAQVALRKAALEGRAAGEDGVAADAEARLVFVAGVRRQKFDRGRWWAEHARAAARRAGRTEAMLAVDDHLGALLVSAGEQDLGIEHIQRALEGRREVLGADHPDTLESLENLAVALARSGRFDEAQSKYEELVALRTGLMGERHPAVAKAKSGLGAVLIARGEWSAARETLDEVLQIQVDAYGRAHPEVESTLDNLGYAQLESGELAAAAENLQEAVALATQLFGAEHPKTLRARLNLARVYAERGDRDKALPIMREVLAGRIKALGEKHPAVERTRVLLRQYEGS